MSYAEKIKILFVINNFGTGGSERLVLDLCRNMNRDIFEPLVAGLTGGASIKESNKNLYGELIEEFDKIGVWNACLNKGEGIDFRLMKRFSQIVRDKQIDVINAHHFSPFVHAALGAISNRCPMIYSEHTVQEIDDIPIYWVIIGALILWRCYGVLGISKGCAERLQKRFHISDKKTFMVLNAIDISRFGHAINKEAKKSELNITRDEEVIGVIGNLREQKNHRNLLKAYRLVRKTVGNVRLLVIGEGPLEGQLIEFSRELGIEKSVDFLGARIDTPELYQVMDLYCLSSHYEGLPLTILEAMASQIPIVATNVSGINDVIVHEQNGFLVEPDNAEKLAEAILYLLDHKKERDRLAANAYTYVKQNHSLGPWVKTYEDLFTRASQQRYT